jgi:hypothetical protein
MDPNVTAGQNAMLGIAGQGQMTNAAQSGIGGIQGILNSGGIGAPMQQGLDTLSQAQGYLDPYARGSYVGNNPYLENIIAANQQGTQNAVNANFSRAGRYGSGAYAQALGSALGNIDANLRYQDYQNQQGNQLNAIGALAGIGNSRADIGQNAIGNIYNAGGALSNLQGPLYSDANAQTGVGGSRMDYQQSQIDAANQAPWTRVGNLAQIAQGIGGMGGTSNESGWSLGPVENNSPSSGQRALGIGLGALGVGANLATGGGFRGMLSGIGGSPFPTGGQGWYSDRRLKKNIKRIGTADNGLPIYAFEYKGGGPRMIGFMADEVAAHNPAAVTSDANGFMMVDYGKASV